MTAHVATAAWDPASTAEDRFEALFEGEFPYVWTSLRRLGVPDRDLEDVTHDVLLAVYRKLDAYDPSRPLRPWLFAFAFRFASSAPGADERIAQTEAHALVLRALESVDLARRAVFVLHELDERTMVEVVDALEIPLQTGYSRLREARKEFAAAVRRLRGGGR